MPDAEDHAPELAPSTSRRRVAAAIVGLMLFLAVVAFVVHFGDIEKFTELLEAAEPRWLILAVLLQAATYVCAASQLHRTLRYAGTPQPLAKLMPLGIAKLFTDQILPTGGVGGTLLVMTGLRRRGIPEDKAMAALLVGFVAYYSAYLIAVLTAVVVLWATHHVARAILVGSAIFCVVAVLLPLSVIWLRCRSEDWELPRYLRLPGLQSLIALIRRAPGGLLSNPALMTATVLTQLAIFVLDGATLWVMLHAIGQGTDLSVAYAAFITASVAATIGLIPTGLGTFEAAGIAALTLLGVGIEPAFTAILLLRGFTTWLPLVPGFWLARREIHGHSARTGADGPRAP